MSTPAEDEFFRVLREVVKPWWPGQELPVDDRESSPVDIARRAAEVIREQRDAARKQRDDAVRELGELKAYLEKLRKPLVESDAQKAAQKLLRGQVPAVGYSEQTNYNQAVLTVLDDLKTWQLAYSVLLDQAARLAKQRDAMLERKHAAERLANEEGQAKERAELELAEVTKERDGHRADAHELEAEEAEVNALLDDDDMPLKGERLSKRIRALLLEFGTVEQERNKLRQVLDQVSNIAGFSGTAVERVTSLQAERNRFQQEHANATRLLNEQSEAIRNAQPKPLGLSELLQQMNDVITAQIDAVGNGSTLAKAANIRRLQVAEYGLNHDRDHGWSVLAQAATALQMRRQEDWPWDSVEQWNKLAVLPLHERCAHAAALLCAAGDVAKTEGL